MPCRVGDISIDVTAPPGPSIPGFGIPTSPVQIPLPDLDLPLDLVEDILALVNRLQAIFPSGIFKINVDSIFKNILDGISGLLNQIAPFLSIYNFFMALLNIIICVIEILCAIPDPFAVASKLKKLFSECLPPFLLLFPWLALIAMILSLILLIIALLEYIITTILGIIEQIIRNIILLQSSLTFQDAEAVLAAAQKIASLLCLMENLFAIFIAIAAIVAIIQSLSQFAGSAICDDGDDSGCCPPEICPSFIKDNKEIFVTNGVLTYHRRIGPDLSASGLPTSLLDLLGSGITLREERWQLYDTSPSSIYPIRSIITPTTPAFFGGSIFFPDQEFEAETPPGRAPYTVDLKLTLDPSEFNHSLGVAREFVIKNCIVVRKPIQGVRLFNNTINPSVGTGTFDLEGGLVYESDGETPVEVNGQQLTLNTFIFQNSIMSIDLPPSDDGHVINNVEFTWKPNHPALAGFDLITVGCFPEVSIEKAVQNAFIQAEGIDSVLNRLPEIGTLADDVLATQQCAQNAINKFRAGINVENAAIFQSEIISCIEDLRDKALGIFCNGFDEAVSIFKSTFSVDTDVQFTTRQINVTVVLHDGGGTNISSNLPQQCLNEILGDTPKLVGNVTLGEISKFEYNSDTSSFTAVITSDKSGVGELTVSYDGQTFSNVIPGLDFETPSSIEEQVLFYEFVDESGDKAERRGPEDIAGV